MEDWDAQLEAKAEEFEELKAKLAPPRDLDVLKAKIKEGIEAEWSDKVEMIAADRDRFKNMMHNVRREHESLKTEFQEATANWSQEVRRFTRVYWGAWHCGDGVVVLLGCLALHSPKLPRKGTMQ